LQSQTDERRNAELWCLFQRLDDSSSSSAEGVMALLELVLAQECTGHVRRLLEDAPAEVTTWMDSGCLSRNGRSWLAHLVPLSDGSVIQVAAADLEVLAEA